MSEILGAIAASLEKIGETTLDAVNELPQWFNDKETFGNIDSFEKADRPFFQITEEEKLKITDNSHFSYKINDYIRNKKELDIYQKSNLVETNINDKPSIIRKDINLTIKDDFGNTNLERMQKGKAPIGSDGKPIELHHIGQKSDSPLAELTYPEHRDNYEILHNKQKSEIDRANFGKIRADHWKTRATILGGNNV